MKLADKHKKYFLGDANAKLGEYINDTNIHGNPISNIKINPCF